MTYTKRVGFFIIVLMGLSSRLSSATSFEFIDSDKRSELIKMFGEAHAPTTAQLAKTWTCEMYGVRTSLQVKRNVALYNFAESVKKSISNEDLKNSGALPIHDYKIVESGLIGKNQTLRDEIKITANGSLVTRLSRSDSDQEILAYSVCQ